MHDACLRRSSTCRRRQNLDGRYDARSIDMLLSMLLSLMVSMMVSMMESMMVSMRVYIWMKVIYMMKRSLCISFPPTRFFLGKEKVFNHNEV